MNGRSHQRLFWLLGFAANALLTACYQTAETAITQLAPNADPPDVVVYCGRLINGLSDEYKSVKPKRIECL